MLTTVQNYSIFELFVGSDGCYDSHRVDVCKSEMINKMMLSYSEKKSDDSVVVLTDRFEYQGWDQVIPIQPEQIFFYDEIDKEKINGASVLEVGVGSGVLSIQSAKLGAKKVVALDINPRARNIAGFNATFNQMQDVIDIRSGNIKDMFSPVSEEKFDYIISNPPFEPTPEGTDYYMNSAAGIYGLDFLDSFFSDVGKRLNENGYMQIVTMAPGNKEEPHLLTSMLTKYFPNQAITIQLDHLPIGYTEFVDRFVDIFSMDKSLVDNMKNQAKKDGVTDIHMCMIHLTKGEKGDITYERSTKLYEDWTTPLGKEQAQEQCFTYNFRLEDIMSKQQHTPLSILGINCVYHESSATLVKDGKVIFAIEEERLNRVKHAKPAAMDNPDVLPHQSINECLRAGKLAIGDIDVIAVSFNPIKRFIRHRAYDEPCIEGSWGTVEGERAYYEKIMTIPGQLTEMGFKGQFMWVDHEMAHASSAFYPSPFEESAIISIDGIGEFESASIGFGRGKSITFTDHMDYPNSIGFLWEKIAMYLGYSEYDACKIMSLASFGDSARFKAHMDTIAYPTEDGFSLDAETLRFRLEEDFSALEELFGIPKREKEEEILPVHHDIAAALQQVTTEILVVLAKLAHKRSGSKNLCMAGGVSLNCVANTVLFEEGPFDNIYIQPAANDAGTSLGAALWAHNCIVQPKDLSAQKMQHTYLGSEFTDEEVLSEITAAGAKYIKLDSIEKTVATLIASGKVVGWFQGALEFGPRALGNRSLLADPRNPDMVKHLNRVVKHREDHRPFCPSVLTEHANEWFIIKKEAEASRYMLMAYPVNSAKKEKIPAVVHVDGTARIQRVDKVTNPRYHRLISEFYALTGVPVMLNTSFNDREPIVCTPKHAISTVMRTNIDYLAIGDYLISKDESEISKIHVSSSLEESAEID